MVCTGWNPHDAGLARMFNAQSGSSSVGAFMSSPGMQPPPPSRPATSSYFPVYNDSVWCGGGYCCYDTPGAYTASSVKSMKEVSLKDSFMHGIKMSAAWNPIGTLGSLFQVGGALCNAGGGVAGGLTNYFSNLGKSGTAVS